jgi:hypothetical protein
MNDEYRDEKLSTSDMVEAGERGDMANAERQDPAARERQMGGDDQSVALLERQESERFRNRWNEVQAAFVDEPRSSVEEADALVAEVMKRIAQMFADERGWLEDQWNRGDEVSTEDLRLALQRYRSFFNRLLSL